MNHRKFLLIFVLIYNTCNAGNNTENPKPLYYFPYTSIVESIPDECIIKDDDQLINDASSLESIFLNTVSDEVTVKDEISYGKTFNDIFKAKCVFVRDNNYLRLQKIFKMLLPFVSRKELHYSIMLVQDDSDINAWTHAGGYIYVTTGLMKFVNSDDELAFCIAHEIGHNENKHCKAIVQRLKTASNFGVSRDLADIASDLYSSVFAAFNQPQEVESDLAGVYLAYRAGYNPVKSLDFFKKLSLSDNHDSIDKFISSHPFPSERSYCLKQYLEKAKK
ncbi:MAG: M48 family metallopeptidase [Chitinophagales bacterium]